MTPYTSEWEERRGESIKGHAPYVDLLADPKIVKTAQADAIVRHIAPLTISEFLAKNLKYREVDNSLGSKGVFPDIWRKVGILKSRLWLGEPTVGEPTHEVIKDLIGHLWLTLYMLEVEEDSEPQEGDGKDVMLSSSSLTGTPPFTQEEIDALRERHRQADILRP